MFERINSGFGPAIQIALLLACVFQPIALPAESVAVRYRVGVGHGFLVLRTPDGKPPEIMLIGANNRTRNLFGIYVVFPRNVGTIRGSFPTMDGQATCQLFSLAVEPPLSISLPNWKGNPNEAPAILRCGDSAGGYDL